MKLTHGKTETMKVPRSGTTHPQTPRLTLAGTAMEESDDRYILGKHLLYICHQFTSGKHLFALFSEHHL